MNSATVLAGTDGWTSMIGYPNDACDRRDVVDEIEVELEHRRVEGIFRTNQQQRVAIRGCPHDRFGGNIAGCATAVLDDERLPESLRQRLTDQSRDDVACSSGAKAFDQTHRPRRVGLCQAKRETVGSAAALAARCRKFRRGSFILNLPSHHS